MDCYGARQAQMERWYEALLRDEDAAERTFIADYGPHAGFLARLQGRVIDIGGGAGLAARYLDVRLCRRRSVPDLDGAKLADLFRSFSG